MIRLAIPAEDDCGLPSLRSSTIDKAPYFAIVEVEPFGGMYTEGVPNTAEDIPQLVELLASHNVDAVLTVGVSVPQALALGDAGISVYRETKGKTVGEAGKIFEFSYRQMQLDEG